MADTLRAVAPYLIVLGLLFAGLENTRRARVGRRASWVIVAAEGLVAFFAAFALLAAVLMGLAFPEGLAGVDVRMGAIDLDICVSGLEEAGRHAPVQTS